MKDEKGKEPEDMRVRTKRFALAIIRAYTRLPKLDDVRVMSRQFLRSGTSAGAHYREACRARSDAEFVSKLEGALQELDETAYWIELLLESRLATFPQASDLLKEIDELISIIVTIVRKTKDRP